MLSLVTPPAFAAVSIETAKAHTRIDHDAEDVLVRGYLDAATEHAENFTRRALVEQEWEWSGVDWPPFLWRLPKPPALSVVSVSYVDPDGATQTLATSVYDVSLPAGPKAAPGVIALAYQQVLPSIRSGVLGAVRIRFKAGYVAGPANADAASAAVPAAIRNAIMVGAAELYERRTETLVGAGVPAPVAFTMRRLLWPFRELDTRTLE